MHRRTRALALVAALAVGTSGCGTTAAGASPTVLTVQVNPGATGEAYRALLGEYDRAEKDVRIVVRDLAPEDALTDLLSDLGRTGLADIVTIDSTWLPELMRYSDLLAAVPKDVIGDEDDPRWAQWAVRAFTDPARRVVGYPAGTAPRALCYRADLLAAAGLPAEPGTVAAQDWPTLLQTAAEYTAATGLPFLDSAQETFFLMMDQLAAPFERRATGEVIATTNPAVRTDYDRVTAVPTVFAGLEPGSDAWLAGAGTGAFAASLCAAGTLGDADAATDAAAADDVAAGTGTLATLRAAGWQVADAFPGGGATSALTAFAVPAAGAHVDRAREVAAWLTAPEQQLALFAQVGSFPTLRLQEPEAPDADVPDAPEDAATPEATAEAEDAASDEADPFASALAVFLRERAAAIPALRFRGPASPEIEALMRAALTGALAGATTAGDAWDRWVLDVDALT